MAQSEKYGFVQVENKQLPDDEPVFVLRAQDLFAGPLLFDYQIRAEQSGCDQEFIDSIKLVRAEFDAWPHKKDRPD